LFERGKEFVRRHTRINRHVRFSFSNAVWLRWSNPLELHTACANAERMQRN